MLIEQQIFCCFGLFWIPPLLYKMLLDRFGLCLDLRSRLYVSRLASLGSIIALASLGLWGKGKGNKKLWLNLWPLPVICPSFWTKIWPKVMQNFSRIVLTAHNIEFNWKLWPTLYNNASKKCRQKLVYSSTFGLGFFYTDLRSDILSEPSVPLYRQLKLPLLEEDESKAFFESVLCLTLVFRKMPPERCLQHITFTCK